MLDIIELLQSTSSTKEKQAILNTHKHHEALKRFLKYTYCPSLSYYVTEKTLPAPESVGTEHNPELLWSLAEQLSSRTVTGHQALAYIKNTLEQLTPEWQALAKMMLLKDARINVGVKGINKVWNNLLVDIPYQRCSLADEETLARIDTAQTPVYVQVKADGVFAVLTPEGMFTRNGSRFPDEFAEYFNVMQQDACIEGEIVWYKDGVLLDRQTANGITNSVMQGKHPVSLNNLTPVFHVWNYIPYKDWLRHECDMTYKERYEKLLHILSTTTTYYTYPIETWLVTSSNDAMRVNNDMLARGMEGSIVKFAEGKWKYNTSNDCIKLKLAVEVDMIVVSMEEATGKNKGMVGRINVTSACGRIVTGVNATGKEADRKRAWEHKEEYVGKVITCTCNDLLTAEGKEGYSLFLGRADVNDVRWDKTDADDLERVVQMFKAKGVVKELVK